MKIVNEIRARSMGPLGAINSRQELARCNLSIAKYPVPWLFTFSFPSSLPVLRTFIPLLSPPRSRLIFFSSETSILRPSFAVGAPVRSPITILSYVGERKKNATSSRNNFSISGEGKEKIVKSGWNCSSSHLQSTSLLLLTCIRYQCPVVIRT